MSDSTLSSRTNQPANVLRRAGRDGRVIVPLGRQEKRSEALARAILHDISEADLAPGALLPPEATMLKQYEVGRTTLREALRILEVNGLISLRPGPRGGPVVESASPREFGRVATLHFQATGFTVGSLIRARRSIEPLIVREAAACQDETLRNQLRRAMHDEELALDNVAALERGAYDFHGALMQMAADPVTAFWALALQDVTKIRTLDLLTSEQRKDVHADHHRIGTAVLNGQAARAEKLMVQHFDSLTAFIPAAALAQLVEWR